MAGLDIERLYSFSAGDPKKQAYVFVLPGVGTRPPASWAAERQPPWLRSFAETAAQDGHGCTVLAVRHKLSPTRWTGWTDLVECGPALLKTIESFRVAEGIQDNPVLIVSHSLAGFVVKSALIEARRAWGQYDALLSALRGLILIGCLQLHAEQRGEWQRALGILLSETRDVDTSRLSAGSALETLFDVSQQFQHAASPIPLLSIHETRSTKLRKAITINASKFSKVTLVDKNAAKTDVLHEELVPVEATHADSCLLEDASALQKTLQFMRRRAFSEPPVQSINIPNGHSLPCRSKEPTQDSYSFTLSASPIEDLTLTPRSSLTRNAKSMTDLSTLPINEEHKREDPKLPCQVVDPGLFVDDFVFRDHTLQIIEDALEHAKSDDDPLRVRYVALHGLGGMGKTSTAAHYWKTRGQKYEAKFWVRADHPEKLVEAFGRIALALGLLDPNQPQDTASTAYNRKLTMDWLENPVRTYEDLRQDHTKPVSWLIVFDNVEDIDILDEFWPSQGGGSIIVTSRNPTTAWRPRDAERRNQGIKVEPFPLAQATEFLQHLAPAAERRRDPGAASELAQRLDCIPFVLRRMGDFIHRKQMTFRRFLEVYQNEAAEGKVDRFQVRSNHYELTMRAVWTVEKVNEQTLSLMNVLALLDPDSINEAILMPGMVTLTDTAYPVSIGDYEDAKSELLVSSLIINKNDDDADEDQIKIHRTVQDAVRARMSAQQFHTAFQTAVELLQRKWPDEGRMWHYPVDRWPYCEKVSSHLIKLHAHYLSNCAANNCSSPTSDFAQLLIDGGWYWYQRGAPDQAKRLFDTSEHLLDRLSDGALLLEDVWLCQGCVATETNERKACLKYYSKLKDSVMARIPEPRTAEDYEKLASTRNELGVSYMMDDRISEAKVEFEAARSYSSVRLRDSEMIFSIFMFATANLGLAHWLEGDFAQALVILTGAHDEYQRRKVKGEKQSFIPGRLMHALGNVKVSEGNVTEGLRWHQKASKHYHQSVGVGHHRTADMAHKIAEDLMRLGKHAEARDCISQALLVFESKKCYAPEQARTTYLLGLLCEMEGEAHSHFEEALDIYKSIKRERGEQMPSGRLQAEHYNALVTFWSR